MKMEEWKEYKLEDICDVRDGTHDTPKQTTDGKYLVTSKHIKGGRIDLSSAYKISLEDFDFINRRSKVDQWDILISMIGTVGEICLISEQPDFAIKNVGLIKTENEDLAKYLYYYLKSPEAQNNISARLKGTTQQYLSLGEIRQFPIKLPPLPTQQKIAAILSSLDDKIELNNKINTNLEQQAQALFKNWFVDFEPFGGKMPEGWKEVEFRDVCENITDGVHNTVVDDPNGEYLLLSCKNIKGGILTIASSERKINKKTFERLRKRTKLAKGDILLSSVGTVGEMYLLNETPDNYEFQRSVAIIKPNTSLISPAFLYESMLFQKDTIIHSAHGAVQQCIFITDVGDFTTILPTIDIIEKFTKIVQPMLDTITANQHENQKLSNMRDTLLPKLMNGEIEEGI